MDLEQLENRVKWLDEERRKDKAAIADLTKQVTQLEGQLEKDKTQIKELESEITRLAVLVEKVDEFGEILRSHRAEVKKEVADQDKRLKKYEREAEKTLRHELKNVEKAQAEFKVGLEGQKKLKASLDAIQKKNVEFEQVIRDLSNRVEKVLKGDEERKKVYEGLEEQFRSELKKFSDLQEALEKLRGRADELRAKIELLQDSQKNAETQLGELSALEAERRKEQKAFVEELNFKQADFERTMEEWLERIRSVEEKAESLTSLEEAELAIKRAQTSYEEMMEQANRRINEISEMQRLGDERLRQNWATFKTEDQKRWSNYTLTQEEQQRSILRKLEQLSELVTQLGDTQQDLRDMTEHLSGQSDKLFQTLLVSLRQWVAENERFMESLR